MQECVTNDVIDRSTDRCCSKQTLFETEPRMPLFLIPSKNLLEPDLELDALIESLIRELTQKNCCQNDDLIQYK